MCISFVKYCSCEKCQIERSRRSGDSPRIEIYRRCRRQSFTLETLCLYMLKEVSVVSSPPLGKSVKLFYFLSRATEMQDLHRFEFPPFVIRKSQRHSSTSCVIWLSALRLHLLRREWNNYVVNKNLDRELILTF